MTQSGIIEAETVSEAWLRYVDLVEPHATGVFQAIVRVRNPVSESSAVRVAVESLLSEWAEKDKTVYPVRTVRTTIFPLHYAQRASNAVDLADAYRKDYPRLRMYPGNRHGTYFGRMIDTQVSTSGDHYDQLNDTIAKLRRNHNATMTEIDLRFETEEDAPSLTIYETEKNHARKMGFPCMSHLSFQRDGALLHIAAFYRNQDVGRKAYGNILGLGQLCEYVAGQAGLCCGSLVMVAGRAYINTPKVLLKKHLPLIRSAAA